MSKTCQITGKKPLVGNRVSKSNIKTKRRQIPNLQTKNIFVQKSRTDWMFLSLSKSFPRCHLRGTGNPCPGGQLPTQTNVTLMGLKQLFVLEYFYTNLLNQMLTN